MSISDLRYCDSPYQVLLKVFLFTNIGIWQAFTNPVPYLANGNNTVDWTIVLLSEIIHAEINTVLGTWQRNGNSLLSLVLFNLLINLPAVGEGRGGGLPFTCFAMCDRVNEGRQGLLEEVNEGSLEPLDKRSVILMLENNILWFGNVCHLLCKMKLKFKSSSTDINIAKITNNLLK